MYEATIPLTKVMINAFPNSFDSTANTCVTLTAALDGIRNGVYKPKVIRVRKVLALQGKADYDRAKAYLSAFTFCGTFTPTRARAHLQQHNGIALGDLDDLSDVNAVKQALASDARTVFVFDSPSVTGLKVAVHIPVIADDAAYKHAWQAVATEYERLYAVRWDPSGKDVSRLCYASHDPDLYVNFNAEVFDVPPAPAPEPRPQPSRPSVLRPHTNHQDYGERAIKTATQMIQSAVLGGRHHARLRASRLLGGYVASNLLRYEEALSALSLALEGHTEDMGKALATVVDGLHYGEAYPITLEALEAERQAWIDAYRTTAPKTRQTPAEHDSWEGRQTLPLKPYQGLRLGRMVRRG